MKRMIIVHLRRPKSNQNELRADPFWEFGSFGCTKCHVKNLMNPKKIERIEGACLGFAQGGGEGFRLVYLTPPVNIIRHKICCEARWETNDKMPFCYDKAPLLVDNDGNSDFPLLSKMLDGVARKTPVSCFSSKFRSRTEPLPSDVAEQIDQTYNRLRQQASEMYIAKHYAEALPYAPPKKDEDRKSTYVKFLREASADKSKICGSLMFIDNDNNRVC